MKERFEAFTGLINKISRNIRKIKNQEMAEYGLRSTHVSCLYYLYSEGSLTATELCERCEEDKATISRALKHLEKNGFISRRAKIIKRYKSRLTLTDKGKEAGEMINAKVLSILDEVGALLPDSERDAFYGYLTAISDSLERVTERMADIDLV